MAGKLNRHILHPLSKRDLLRAIRLGHGRALIDLRAFGPRGMASDIERLMESNHEYDPQCSGGVRAWYTHEIARATDPSGKMLRRVLSKLGDQTSYWERRHLQALAAIEARRGETWAYRLLLSAMRKWPIGFDAPVHTDLIELGGVPVLIEWLIRAGRVDPERVDGWDLKCALKAAAKRGGGVQQVRKTLIIAAARNQHVRKSINSAAYHDQSLRRAFRRVLDIPTPTKPASAQPQVKEPRTSEESRQFVLAWLAHGGPSVLRSMAKKHAVRLTPQDSNHLIALLEQQTSKPSFNVLLWRPVLDVMPIPTRVQPLLRLSRHGEWRIRCHASRLLGRINKPSVRKHALRLLSDRPEIVASSGLESLRSSFKPGDETAVLTACKHMRGERFVHSMGLDLRKLAESQPLGDWHDVLLWLYEHTPCGICRDGALELLIKRAEVTREILNEALFDGCADVRTTARKAKASVGKA